jgi:cohesin loading factor subunit SCC2
VRKRAIRALWECCSCPGFSRADDAVVAVLGRANDREDSMKNLVTKICGEMWFTDASNFAGEDRAKNGSFGAPWI